MTVQLSILTIVGYGPWTLTLGSDREHELQMLQASIYGEIQKLFSERGCLAFANRSDELVVFSTGLGLDEHAQIQDILASKFENVRLRIAIGRGATPAAADKSAHESSENRDYTLDEERMIYGPADVTSVSSTSSANHAKDLPAAGSADARRADTSSQASIKPGAIIMHMDIDGLSGRKASPYMTSLLMLRLYQKMSEYFYDRCDSITFFMGGDNFMIISSEDAKHRAGEFLRMMWDQEKIQLNCGIGSAATAREAAKRATESLDMIRKMRDDMSDDDNTMNRPDQNHNDDKTPVPYPRVYEHATGRSY